MCDIMESWRGSISCRLLLIHVSSAPRSSVCGLWATIRLQRILFTKNWTRGMLAAGRLGGKCLPLLESFYALSWLIDCGGTPTMIGR
jgi:hypothetical protein